MKIISDNLRKTNIFWLDDNQELDDEQKRKYSIPPALDKFLEPRTYKDPLNLLFNELFELHIAAKKSSKFKYSFLRYHVHFHHPRDNVNFQQSLKRVIRKLDINSFVIIVRHVQDPKSLLHVSDFLIIIKENINSHTCMAIAHEMKEKFGCDNQLPYFPSQDNTQVQTFLTDYCLEHKWFNQINHVKRGLNDPRVIVSKDTKTQMELDSDLNLIGISDLCSRYGPEWYKIKNKSEVLNG